VDNDEKEESKKDKNECGRKEEWNNKDKKQHECIDQDEKK